MADASPLIGLARIGRLELLRAMYGSVVIPAAVAAELAMDSGRPGARALGAARDDGLLAVHDLEIPARPHWPLDAGEAAAIHLAEHIGASFLLIDERRGREFARRRGLPVVGSAGILLAAKRRGLLASVTDEIDKLAAIGYRLAPRLVDEVRRLADEEQ